MCGYIFSYDRNTSVTDKKERGNIALKALTHRGPDQSNITVKDEFLLGHCRLSIIDIEGSIQPMSDPSGRYHLVFNGELYNYKKIRKNLENDWQFKTNGDTEVLMAIMVLNKKHLFDSLEGMWSFVFWDQHEKRLQICRDRIGKKPAYYCLYKYGIAVASELSALIKLIPNAIEEDLNSTADFFRYGFYLPGTTAYKNIKEVLPGHSLIWTPDSVAKQEAYWTLRTGIYKGSKEEACSTLNKLLIESVKRRLVADVEVGAFLSGGIDSSLIVCIISKILNINPKTFTVKFSNAGFDESKFSEIISDYCNTDHYVQNFIDVNPKQLSSLIVNNVGQPFGDSSILPTSLVSETASKYVKVALSGDGADELFSGYQRYQARSILRWYSRLPRGVRSSFEKLIRHMPEPFTHHSKSILKKAHLFVEYANQVKTNTQYVAPRLFRENDFSLLIPDLINFGHEPPKLEYETSLKNFEEMMFADMLVYLPQDILLKVDRASMANSLEVRSPFLDKKLIEFSFSLDSNWHRKNYEGKKMLRSSFKKLLPNKIWSRRKQGFSVPIGDWLRSTLGEELIEFSKNMSGVVDDNFINKLFQEHLNGTRDHSHRLWSLYTYYLWKYKFCI